MIPFPVKVHCPNCGAVVLSTELEWSDEHEEYVCPVCEDDPTTFEDEYPPTGDIGC